MQRVWWWGLLWLLLQAGGVVAQTTRYDDFSGAALSQTKWLGQQIGGGVLETVRQIRGGQLVMGHRVLGNHLLSTGQNISRNLLQFQTFPGRNFTALRFRVQVQDLAVEGCPEGAASRSFAGFSSALFNDTDNGIVGAFLFLERRSDADEPPEVLHAIAGIFRCPGNDCAKAVHVGEEDLGPVAVGERVTLHLEWDGPVIRFHKNQDPPVSVRHGQEVATRRSGRTLEVRGEAANCPNDPHTQAALIATFDNIFIGP